MCECACFYDTCNDEGSPNLNMTLKYRSRLDSGGHMRIRTDQSLSVMSFIGTQKDKTNLMVVAAIEKNQSALCKMAR